MVDTARMLRAFFASLLVGTLFLVASVSRSGIWDPYELDRSELGRRIAVRLYGSEALAGDAALTMPTLGDLGMGELPFTSMAAGFSLFGMHDWAGRLPLALWALAGVLVLHVFLARIVHPRAGLYGAIALCTMPLYFLQARTMLGDAVTMAALCMAFCGLAGAQHDPSRRAAAAWLLLSLCGLIAGYLCRGALVGVAVPCLGVGVAWLVLLGAQHPRAPELRVRAVGAVALGLGLYATMRGVEAFELADSEVVGRAMGAAQLSRPPAEATFDLVVRDLGHALFPWSAFLPFAFGRLFSVPVRVTGARREREVAVRAALLVTAAIGYAAHTWLATRTGALPFSSVALLAGIAALAIIDFERGAPPSGAIGGGTAVLAVLLLADFRKIPDKALAPFGVGSGQLPVGFVDEGAWLLAVATIAFSVIVALGWLEHGAQPVPLRVWLAERVHTYRQRAVMLRDVWNGNLMFVLLLVEAAAIGIGVTLLLGRHFAWPSVVGISQLTSYVAINLWWALPLTLLLTPILCDALRMAFRAVLARVKLPRASTTALAGLIAGGLMCFGYYPALAGQMSPKEVFDTYQVLRRSDEPLAVLGVRDRTAKFYAAGAEVSAVAGAAGGSRFLADAPEGVRHWLVFRASYLPELNALHRKRTGRNLPVLDARSQQIMLAASTLDGGPSANPLDALVWQAPPDELQHPVDGVFEDRLELLGWELRDEDGELAAYAVPSRDYQLRMFYRVLAPLRRKWRVFLHIDGYGRRHNGDHAPLEGRYDTSYWQPGDVVVDSYRLRLAPNFQPGRYGVHVGFFTHGKNRMKPTRGNHYDNRLNAGGLRVR